MTARGLLIANCLSLAGLMTIASPAGAWCARDCIAVCRILSAQTKTEDLAGCIRQRRCDAYRGEPCDGPKAAAKRASQIIRGQEVIQGN